MSDFILHLTTRTAWLVAQERGQYAADSLAGEGFIHCSKVDQILRVADVYFTGQHGLVLLVIEPKRLNSELLWEPAVGLATELFPHIYGPINMDAVVEVLDFDSDTDGKFRLPKPLEFPDS